MSTRNRDFPLLALAGIFLFGIGLISPAYAKEAESQMITRAALRCGAIFYVMGSLSHRDGESARLITNLGKMMEDVYLNHTGSAQGKVLTQGDMANAKERAVNELVERYHRDPRKVEGDYLQCDAWSVSLEEHFTNNGLFNSRKAMILAVPPPQPRDNFFGEINHDVRNLLHSAFEGWRLRGGTGPMDEYLQFVIDEIERECLRAWPGEILEEITGVRTLPPGYQAGTGMPDKRFLSKGMALEKGIFYPSRLHLLLPALREVVGPGKRFLDLGSGDGRVVFLANVLGADATGIEFDGELIEVSRKALRGLEDIVDRQRLHLIEGDFFTQPWSGYDVVFYYDQSSYEEERVREKLNAELPAQAVLIVNLEVAPFPGMELVRAFPYMKILRKSVNAGKKK